MLDMWLPILQPLREKLDDAEFVFIVPLGRQIGVFDLSSALFRMADQIFDTVVFPAVTGKWMRAKSFAEAQDLHEAESLVRIWRWVKKRIITRRLGKLLMISLAFTSSIGGPRITEPGPALIPELSGKETVILFNIYQIEKPYMAELARILPAETPKFSLYHGIRLETSPLAPIGARSEFPSANTTALVFSAREEPDYIQKFGLAKKSIRVVGVPRHEEEWIAHLQGLYQPDELCLPKRFIFVISRPAGDPALSRASKVSALRSIRAASEKFGLHVLIKLHPKEEKDDGTASEILGLENLGRTWSYSNVHPLLLGKHCEFGVSFLSSVAIDMARIGVPVIEHLDWNIGDPIIPAQPCTRDGKPISIISHLGLALPSHNHSSFMKNVDLILNDPANASHRALEAYRKVFPQILGINDKIVRMIELALKTPR